MGVSIYILCGDATYNRGDRVNLCSQIQLLRTRFKDAQIIHDSYRPEVDEKWYKARVIPRGLLSVHKKLYWLAKSDVVVWGGGALMADNASRVLIPYWLVVIAFVRFILRKPIMAWAHGVIINTKSGAFLAKITYSLVNVITVRDKNSFQAVQKLGLKKVALYQTGDPAVLAQASPPERGKDILQSEGITDPEQPTIVLAATFCSFHYNSKDIIPYMIARRLALRRNRGQRKFNDIKNAFVQIVDMLLEHYPHRILLIPTYPAPWEDDLEHFRDIRSRTHQPQRVFVLQRDEYAPGDYMALWNYFYFVIAVPMHHNIISTIMGVPCLNIFYEPKGRDFFDCLGASERLMSIEDLCKIDGPDKVLQKIGHILSKWDILSRNLQAPLGELQAMAHQNLDHLDTLIKKEGLG